ncbi:FAD-dependent oxidoreductase [Horticoccus luteus]|uniref:FAD-dependent oxidoreductase n=1 Tax=Horticoccus luteus TaxID=2862869 RepID=A0A8F9XLX7_9BACT|nr:FAD-dependent oxidoreductase [Horticoccus luteus]QYM79676.1 FAD-dependent oxidoreductase [Horticoccus luteus]
MNNARSVIVVGGGVVGLCTAYYLAREGFAVTVVERSAEGADSCAHGSAGYVSPSHVVPLSAPGMVKQGLKWMLSSRSPFYIKPRLDPTLWRWAWLFAQSCTPEHTRRAAPLLRDLCVAARALFGELAAQTGNAFELRREGLLNLCQTEEMLEHETHGLARLANELGVEARTIDAREAGALEPGIKMKVVGAVYFPGDAHLSPRKFVPVMAARAREAGVAFRWETTVRGWATAGGRVTGVATSTGLLTADEYVIATGSWAGDTVTGLRLRVPMQAGKGYSLTLARPRWQLTKSLILTERRVAVTPMGETLRFGGTMEISGHDGRVRPERVEQIVAGARAFFPEMTAEDFAGVKPWFGYRPVSPDGLPYIGRFGRYANLTAACGHAMLGLTMAPITGVLVADVLAGRAPRVDLAMLRPDRFA